MQGWFKVHRELFESELWHDVSTLRLFLFLLAKASHKDGIKTIGIELKRGQYIRSYRKLADDLSYKEGRGYKKYSLSTIKSCVNKLVESERVNVQETEAGTLFTIVNYAKYQELEGGQEETPNTQNEEVRTNAELTPNEVRTNSEQEQELKNLRTKELKNNSSSSAIPDLDDADLKESIEFYEQQGFGPIAPLVGNKMAEWINDLSKDLVILAMTIAIENSVAKWSYAEGILSNWSKRNFTTVDQVMAFEQQRKQQSKQPSGTHRRFGTPREEHTPEWFGKEPAKPQTKSNPDIEREREQLLRELREGANHENYSTVT